MIYRTCEVYAQAPPLMFGREDYSQPLRTVRE